MAKLREVVNQSDEEVVIRWKDSAGAVRETRLPVRGRQTIEFDVIPRQFVRLERSGAIALSVPERGGGTPAEPPPPTEVADVPKVEVTEAVQPVQRDRSSRKSKKSKLKSSEGSASSSSSSSTSEE